MLCHLCNSFSIWRKRGYKPGLVPCSNRKETIFGKLSCNRGWVSILEKPCHLSIVGLSRHSLPRNVHRNLFLIGFLCLFSLCSYIIELIHFYSTKRKLGWILSFVFHFRDFKVLYLVQFTGDFAKEIAAITSFRTNCAKSCVVGNFQLQIPTVHLFN